MAENPLLAEIMAENLVFPEIESLEDYYSELHYFVYENFCPVMIYKRNDLSENRFEFFTQTIHSGIIRTYTTKMDSIYHPQSIWIVERESCLLMIDDIDELMLPALIVAEKQRYVKLNLRLLSERKIFNNQGIELITCRKNPEFNFCGYMVMFVKPDFDFWGYMLSFLKIPVSLHDEMSDLDEISDGSDWSLS